MARLILVDPWIQDAGGHNFQYAIDILRAAEAMDRETVLAVNKRFAPPAPTSRCTVISAFDFQPCHRYWLGPDGKLTRPLDVNGNWLKDPAWQTNVAQRAAHRWRRCCDVRRWDRRRRLARYASDCRRLFRRIAIGAEDQVFFPSLSDFEFLGLVAYLESTPASRNVPWHLQFHFDIFEGWSYEYPSQPERLSRFRRQFAAALQRIPEHRLYFYGTTEQIVEQYNRMRVTRFQPLPYPVSQDLQPTSARIGDGPLRVTCAGAVRREKGRIALSRLIHEILHGRLAGAGLQLVFQANRNALRRLLPREAARAVSIHDAPDASITDPIVPVAFPLEAEAYGQLIRQAEIGLFLYDARRYHARCSGVLSEMLAAGVPTLVPAGCWLADQQAGPLGDYVNRWLCHAEGTRHAGSCVHVAVSTATRALAVRVGGLGPVTATEYVELRVQQHDAAQRAIGAPQQEIVSRTPHTDHAATVVPCHASARHVRLEVRRAYQQTRLEQPVWDIAAIGPPTAGPDTAVRLGGVGLSCSSLDCIAEKLEEIATHYEQYRAAAVAFSRRWRHDHAARRTLEALSANDGRQPDLRVA